MSLELSLIVFNPALDIFYRLKIWPQMLTLCFRHLTSWQQCFVSSQMSNLMLVSPRQRLMSCQSLDLNTLFSLSSFYQRNPKQVFMSEWNPRFLTLKQSLPFFFSPWLLMTELLEQNHIFLDFSISLFCLKAKKPKIPNALLINIQLIVGSEQTENYK